MARQKKGIYERKAFETTKPGSSDIRKEPYTALYVSMLTSEAWRNLSHGARSLYTYMKMQYQSKANRDAGLQPNEFYFNHGMYEKLGFKNRNQFIKWRNELVENGFIDVVECGRTSRTKNIYQYSDRWHDVKAVAKERNKGTLKRLEQTAHD